MTKKHELEPKEAIIEQIVSKLDLSGKTQEELFGYNGLNMNRILETEMDEHLGYKKYSNILKRQLSIPRGCPQIISLYSRGMTNRDIQSHLNEIYGVEVSPELISKVTDAVHEDVRSWRTRPLDSI